jgi:cellulose synthase/poly-beta-1,6-N-acetylglucosamine synthase-like glycosyltransferase
MKIVYVEDAVVYTEGATDFAGLIKQRLRWKRGRFETFLKYRPLFFSTDKKHNKILSWIILPLAIFGDMQLSFELFFIIFLYVYSYMINDYSSFISGIIVVASMFVVQIIFDIHKEKRGRLLLLAPIGWLLLYVSTFVEFSALLKTFLGYARGEEVKWQNWKRKGVFIKEPSIKRDLL